MRKRTVGNRRASRKRVARVPARSVARFRRARHARTEVAGKKRSPGLSARDRRILGLASRVIEEDQGLLRRLAER